ncbi:hypothetical protein [Streptomyces sp. H34-S4]|uniref:hypothetical protein n=1 Tax=Streptomyces sp. H34-S4 TaxID=2996463 RepID=UPI0022703312|nr:hypothetical protein [Streptomyces sp. H34-S4]MCY0937782.1 hypothetical protein [Streptomyces sp. H34-S4]
MTQTPDRLRWVIYDSYMDGYCTLPDDVDAEYPNLLPLEWRTRAAAEAWLRRCYAKWGTGLVTPPWGWKPVPPVLSPYLMTHAAKGWSRFLEKTGPIA